MILNFKSDFQEKTYKELLNLVKEKEFFYKDYDIKDTNFFYRIFNYTLPGYMQFSKPSARECRGIMFLVSKIDNSAELIALPMKKFFSFGEGDPKLVKSHNIEKAKHIYLKEDGSLMTSYVSPITDELKLKSKGKPEYVNKSVLEKSLYKDLYEELYKVYKKEKVCIDLELTSPENRVLMEYKEYKLYVLSARSLITGEKIDIRSRYYKDNYPNIYNNLVKEISLEDLDLNRNDIEGFVLEMENDELLKLKTIPYLSIVSVINIQDMSKLASNLYSAAVNEVLDEVRTLYHYKNRSENFPIDLLIKQTEVAEEYARNTYLPLVELINNFYTKNKNLEIKDYIIEAQKEEKDLMAIFMSMYKGKKVDIKSFAIRKYGSKALLNM